MLATDRKLPLSGGREKRAYVRGIFTAIAPRYDFLNHLLSLNIDRRWRRQAVARLGWKRAPSGRYLDLCAGTLDLAVALDRQPGFAGQVIGADFVLPMLALGLGKSARVRPVNADALELPFPDASFDGATVGFGVRNLADLDAGLAEAARVLRPGARFVILEFTTPPRQPMRGLYFFYFRRVLPLIGRMVSRHRDAYDYLPESVLAFPEPDALAARMKAQGFAEVAYTRLFGGICAIHVGVRGQGTGVRGQGGESTTTESS
jgi:demethylmenaquinone methyltransferase/2-methoxy-6-polyprenyl-1,4-benzoquinol methylase